MGYEVNYKYYEKTEEGYDTTEIKTMTKRYGKKTDDLPLEKIASLILRELSRRDIWVTDVNVFQFVKKEIKFKEVKGGGIILGHKKFNLDLTHVDLSEEIEDEESKPNSVASPKLAVTPRPITRPNEPVLRTVIFKPPAALFKEAKKYQLTVGRKYGLYEERITGTVPTAGSNATLEAGLISYRLLDDTGKMAWVNSFLFEDFVQMSFQNEMRSLPQQQEMDLMNSPEFMTDNLTLRR
jgi:hypothetical protein